MSSTGVCYVDQLGGFGSGPYKVLHDRYRNSMYKSFTHADLKDYILREEDNPYLDTYQELLLPHVERESDVTITPKGSLVNTWSTSLIATPAPQGNCHRRTESSATRFWSAH
jgi:hypothetical protein